MAAWADVSGTQTLQANTNFSFDTGATVASGGDVAWTGSQLSFVGSAKGGSLAALGLSGTSGFTSATQAVLQALASFASTTPIPASALSVGTIVGLSTNGGNSAKFLVTAVSGTSITFQYTTYESGVSTPPTGPTVTGLANNYSGTPLGFANSGIAQGSLFVIYGTDLATSTTAVLQNTLVGLPTQLNGASVTVTVGGTVVHPGLYYATATAIAAELPSTTPVGTGTLTVSNGTTSAAFTFQVVASAMGLDTYYGTGSGLIVATDPLNNAALITYTNSAKPGNTYTLWGSGLGADTADSDTVFTSTPHASSTPFALYVGGQLATVSYKGSSGYPGVDIVNFVVPTNVTPGCYVSVIGISNSDSITNSTSIPIAVGGGVCTDSEFGINGNQISTLSGQSTVSSGGVFVEQSTSNLAGTNQTAAEAFATFNRVTSASYGSGSGVASIGSCTISESTNGGGGTSTVTGLNAGTITVTQPSGGPVTLTSVPSVAGDYFAQLATIPPTGGTFVFTGGGGTDVGPFTATVNFPNPLLVWTNQSAAAAVTRAQGLTVNWTGGAAGSYVIISGSSSNANATGFYTCLAPVAADTFMVPYYILLGLPAGTGSTEVGNNTSYGTFAATGISSGVTYGGLAFAVTTTYN